jgi:hypothetical protein
MIYTHVLNKDGVHVTSPADMLGKGHHQKVKNQFNDLSTEIAEQFFEIVLKRYNNNFEAAITAFIKLHGKK